MLLWNRTKCACQPTRVFIRIIFRLLVFSKWRMDGRMDRHIDGRSLSQN